MDEREAAAQAETIVELRKRVARLEIALVMTAGRYGNLELGRQMNIRRRPHGGRWLIYRGGVEANFARDPGAAAQRYDTVLQAFDAAAEE